MLTLIILIAGGFWLLGSYLSQKQKEKNIELDMDRFEAEMERETVKAVSLETGRNFASYEEMKEYLKPKLGEIWNH